MIQGKKVVLRIATEQDKQMIYKWMVESDITPSMMRAPNFPDNPVPTWDKFCTDWKSHYFDGLEPTFGRCFIITVDGTPVGTIAYNNIDERHRRTELDIWMSCESNCSKGYGPDALQTLCKYLFQTYGVIEFMMQPSARNSRAIRAFEKTGFQRLDLTLKEIEAKYGPRDYYDSVLLIKHMSKTQEVC